MTVCTAKSTYCFLIVERKKCHLKITMNLWGQKTWFLVPCNAKSVTALVTYSPARTYTHTAGKYVTQAFAFIKLIDTADLVCCNTVHILGSVHVMPSFFNTLWYTLQESCCLHIVSWACSLKGSQPCFLLFTERKFIPEALFACIQHLHTLAIRSKTHARMQTYIK